MVAYLQGPLVPPLAIASTPIKGFHPLFACFPPHSQSFLDDCCLTVGSWVIFYANCKLSVKIVVIGLIQQCQPNGPIAGPWAAGVWVFWVLGRWHHKERNRKNRTKNEAGKVQKQQKISRTGKHRTQNTKMTISETKHQNRQKQGHEIESAFLVLLEMHLLVWNGHIFG